MLCVATWLLCVATWPLCGATWLVCVATWLLCGATWLLCGATWLLCGATWLLCCVGRPGPCVWRPGWLLCAEVSQEELCVQPPVVVLVVLGGPGEGAVCVPAGATVPEHRNRLLYTYIALQSETAHGSFRAQLEAWSDYQSAECTHVPPQCNEQQRN